MLFTFNFSFQSMDQARKKSEVVKKKSSTANQFFDQQIVWFIGKFNKYQIEI